VVCNSPKDDLAKVIEFKLCHNLNLSIWFQKLLQSSQVSESSLAVNILI
jgi:hypothetical protein